MSTKKCIVKNRKKFSENKNSTKVLRKYADIYSDKIVNNDHIQQDGQCSYFKEEITAEALAMMSKMSQAEMISNVQRSSLIRGNYSQDAGKGSSFTQMFEQEEKKLSQEEFNGLNETDVMDNVSRRMEGKVHVYDHQGMLNYFRMTISMTDLKG